MKDSGVPVMCCGQKMTEIIPGTSDGAVEKHLPVYPDFIIRFELQAF